MNLSLPSTYISKLNLGQNIKPKPGCGIQLNSLQIGNMTADNLKYINASATTFDDAALILGAMGSKTIGVGIIASAHSSTSGYVKFANGLIIQYGTTNITNSLVTQKLPIQFSSPSSYQLLATSLLDSDRWAIGIKDSALQSS